MSIGSPKAGNIDNIQVMRGVAASLVVLFHCLLVALEPRCHRYQLCREAVTFGASGVDMFFVISGFIMMYTSRAAFGSAGAAADFLVRRAIRIIPLYWLLTTLFIGLMLLRKLDISTTHVVFSYLFLPESTSHGGTRPVLAQGWTLSYEWYFYLVFAIWMALGSRQALAKFGWLVFLLIGALAGFTVRSETARTFLQDGIVLEFCLGMALAVMYEKGIRMGGRTPAIMVAGGMATLFAAAHGLAFMQSNIRWLLLGVPAACALWGMINLRVPAGICLTSLLFLGDASYSIYLSHLIVTLTMSHYVARMQLNVAMSGLVLLLGVSACIAVGSLIYITVERPMNHWLRRIHSTYRNRASPLASERIPS